MNTEPAHAKLSASGSDKWMACTPSARLEEDFQDESSEFAREGTFAHAVFEQDILAYLGRTVEPLPSELAHFDTPDLREHVATAVQVAIGLIEAARAHCKDAVVMVEQRLNFSRWVPEGFGTGDLVIIADDVVDVADLKFGKGIAVMAENNSQMRLYGLGALDELGHLYDVKRVRMTILQPRLDNWSSEELSAQELLGWADSHVVPRAKLAWAGEGPFVPGAHCTKGFCKARFTCAARAEEGMSLARESFSLLKPELLTTDQVVAVLERADMALGWLSDVKEFALKAANEGVNFPGFKLVEGKSNRRYIDADLVAQRLINSGFDEANLYNRSLLGITAMEAIVTKKKFAELLGDLVEKPPGKPTLVPASDKRASISHFTALDAQTASASATQHFLEIK